jgi:hypothetical protein
MGNSLSCGGNMTVNRKVNLLARVRSVRLLVEHLLDSISNQSLARSARSSVSFTQTAINNAYIHTLITQVDIGPVQIFRSEPARRTILPDLARGPTKPSSRTPL